MRRAILFRYHKEFQVCADHVAWYRRVNPGVPIYGLYGGPLADVDSPARAALSAQLDHDWVFPDALVRETPVVRQSESLPRAAFTWQQGDMCIAAWFADQGRDFAFDMLHVVEWDMIATGPFCDILAHVTGGVAITDQRTIRSMREEKWYWVEGAEKNAALDALRDHILLQYGRRLDDDTQVIGVFGGASLSRDFLEKYARESVPACFLLLNDEIRVPAFALAYGLPVFDTGFRGPLRDNPCWHAAARGPLFTCADIERYRGAYPAFHPVREAVGEHFVNRA